MDSFLIRDQPRLVQSHASLKFLTEMLRLLAVVARQDKGKEREKKKGKLDDDVTGYGKLNYGRLLLRIVVVVVVVLASLREDIAF
mgnify:CR=1 FL=1